MELAQPAPLLLAPALRVIRPLFTEPFQDPLLPWAAPDPPPPAEEGIPDAVRQVIGNLASALVEVLRGRRPITHLEPHAHPRVIELVERLIDDGALSAVRLGSLHLSRPAPQIIEAAARLKAGPRCCAAALGYARAGSAWRMTALELALPDCVILRAT